MQNRSPEKLKLLARKLEMHNIDVIPAVSIPSLCQNADLITTVTPSTNALVESDWLKPNVHINAFGCDTKGKRELASSVFSNASHIIADSLSQCLQHGELQYLNECGNAPAPLELGIALMHNLKKIEGISVCDFTGVAIQDIKISEGIYRCLLLSNRNYS